MVGMGYHWLDGLVLITDFALNGRLVKALGAMYFFGGKSLCGIQKNQIMSVNHLELHQMFSPLQCTEEIRKNVLDRLGFTRINHVAELGVSRNSLGRQRASGDYQSWFDPSVYVENKDASWKNIMARVLIKQSEIE